MKKLNIKAIRIDGGTQSRVEINNDVVAEYAESLTAGAVFPPITVFFDGADYWLADGFHRFHAYNKVGIVSIEADIHQGTVREAKLFSFGANGDHGQRRSNADKRKAVSSMLEDAEWAKWSDNQIAKQCSVSQPFVSSIRSSLITVISEKPVERAYINKHGTESVMDTRAIGKSDHAAKQLDAPAPVAAPVPPPAPEAVAADEPEDDGPSAEELAANAAAEQGDREALEKLLESDDKLATAYAEIKRLNAELAQMRISRDGYMNKCNEAIALVKSRDRTIAKLERQMKESA